MLCNQVLDRYVGRLTDRAETLLKHVTTELYLGLYKRGYWMFRCGHNGDVAAIKQTMTGRDDDIRIRTPIHEQWLPAALEVPR